MAKLAQLRSKLIGQKTTPGIVKFPMSTEEAALNIEVAFQVEVEKRGNTYVNSEELHNHIWQIAELFTKPTNKFGIMLCGGVGNGKSTMMYALQNLIRSLEIPLIGNTTFSTYGMRIESAKFIYNQVKVDSKEYLHLQQINMLGIDDLGEEEPTLISYGNRVTPVIDLLSYRYNRMLFTMVTTNLTPPQIRMLYGIRIADRFNEMMLILNYQGLSFRTP
ncbi:MAG: hypothetical protein IJ693_04640 [Bacteroidaceae bacterium]|nr:hypothetical protein [Bacteroidaceae bacterium]